MRRPQDREICGSRSRRSWRWSPSRSSCSPTPRSSATSAPPQLAGLGIAAVVLQTVVGLCVFLAYGTTASVARRLGAGDRRARPGPGHRRDLAGRRSSASLVTVVGVALTDPLVAAFGAGPEVSRAGDDVPADRLPRHHPAARHARRHRRAARPAGHPHPAGRRRGRQRASTSCSTCCSSTAARRDGLGIAGSALGSVLAQVASAAALARRRGPRRPARGRRCGPTCPGSARPPAPASPLVVRTAHPARGAAGDDVRRALGADASGDDQAVDLATHQLAFTIWTLPRLRARRDRDRRPGDHRALPRRRRRRRAPGPSPAG